MKPVHLQLVARKEENYTLRLYPNHCPRKGSLLLICRKIILFAKNLDTHARNVGAPVKSYGRRKTKIGGIPK